MYGIYTCLRTLPRHSKELGHSLRDVPRFRRKTRTWAFLAAKRFDDCRRLERLDQIGARIQLTAESVLDCGTELVQCGLLGRRGRSELRCARAHAQQTS